MSRISRPAGAPEAPSQAFDPPGTHASVPASPTNPFAWLIDRFVRVVHRGKHAPHLPQKLTHERPIFDLAAPLPGIELGLTVSELHAVRAGKGREVVHVVGRDGSSNLELVLGSRDIGHGQRVELQGPALNTQTRSGTSPVGVRLVGVGVTGDLVDPHSAESVSYTLEAKITGQSIKRLAALVTPASLASAVAALEHDGGAAAAIAEGFAVALPVVSTVIAISTARWAMKVCRSPESSRQAKALAVAHACADTARIFFPVAGTIANAALVMIGAAPAVKRILELDKRPRVGKQETPVGTGAL